MNEQELRAKALEIAALMLGPTAKSNTPLLREKILDDYLPLADLIARYISALSQAKK
jgi:hypothetical protein